MKPSKIGEIVKFHTPNADEEPNQEYVIVEIHLDVEKPRCQIQPLNTGLKFPPLNTVLVEDLEVVKVKTNDLIGHYVTIQKSDFSEVYGKVTKVSEQEIILSLSLNLKGVETNVWITVEDEKSISHTGFLVVHQIKV